MIFKTMPLDHINSHQQPRQGMHIASVAYYSRRGIKFVARSQRKDRIQLVLEEFITVAYPHQL